MTVHWKEGTVVEVEGQKAGVQYVSVRKKGESGVERAIHYTDVQPPLSKGDAVVLNTTAVDLSLGSGGYHFVAWKVGELKKAEPLKGHIMKLRYTPWQLAVQSAEEESSPHHDVLKGASDLDGMPVLAGELHSMLPILTASLRHVARERDADLRIAYVMTDGAALPIQLSKHVSWLKEREWIVGTVTAGHAYGGDLEAVNVYSGLLTAKYVLEADVAIVLMGPGIVGTGTAFGFTGVEQGQIVNAAHALGGVPVVVPRISFADGRKRHWGISHHTLTNLSRVVLRPTRVALPQFEEVEWQAHIDRQIAALSEAGHSWMHIPLNLREVEERLQHYPPITSMGRGLSDDPAFFIGVSCAADAAWAVMSGT